MLFKKTDNHIPLCVQHHNYVSAKFDARHKIGTYPAKKVEWLNRQRVPTDKWTPKKVKVLPNYE